MLPKDETCTASVNNLVLPLVLPKDKTYTASVNNLLLPLAAHKDSADSFTTSDRWSPPTTFYSRLLWMYLPLLAVNVKN